MCQVGSLHEPTHSAGEPKTRPAKRDAEDSPVDSWDAKKSKNADSAEKETTETTETKPAEASEPAEAAPATGPIKAPPEMSFCLRWDEEHDIAETKFYSLEKPYLRTSSAISVLHLKKYLTQKFELKPDATPLRFRCRGQLLGDKLKVAEVYEQIWKDANQDLELHYCTTEPN